MLAPVSDLEKLVLLAGDSTNSNWPELSVLFDLMRVTCRPSSKLNRSNSCCWLFSAWPASCSDEDGCGLV